MISESIDLKSNRCNVNTVLSLELGGVHYSLVKRCVVCRLAFTAHLTLIYDLCVNPLCLMSCTSCAIAFLGMFTSFGSLSPAHVHVGLETLPGAASICGHELYCGASQPARRS